MKIYFDMDGVLVDFAHNAPKHENSEDLNHSTEELSPEQRRAKEQFWMKIEQQDNFWRDMPKIKDVELLLSLAKSIGDIFILSKTPSAKHFVNGEKYVKFVAAEKRKWVLKNLNNFFDAEHIIICNRKKGEFFNPTKDDILVDDRPENIKEWESHGGTGVLFTDVKDCIERLKKYKTS